MGSEDDQEDVSDGICSGLGLVHAYIFVRTTPLQHLSAFSILRIPIFSPISQKGRDGREVGREVYCSADNANCCLHFPR